LDDEEYEARNDGSGRYRVQTRAYGGAIDFQLGVFGSHQVPNALLAIRLVESLEPFGVIVPAAAVRAALETARIRGRLEKLMEQPPFFVDGGHNPPAIEAVARFIRDQFPEKVHLIFGMMRDKEIAACAAFLAPLCRTLFLSPIANRRSATAEQLREFFPDNRPVITRNSEEAISLAFRAAEDGGTLIACGSLYLVGEIQALLEQ
jgi:folylpolyglutamate synthase/dihydropteroate synthase